MPKFAANLSFMFQDIGFLERFDAAARAGFKAVEFLFPYEHPPAAIAERLEKNRLTLALFNTVPGDWNAGERGLAALAYSIALSTPSRNCCSRPGRAARPRSPPFQSPGTVLNSARVSRFFSSRSAIAAGGYS